MSKQRPSWFSGWTKSKLEALERDTERRKQLEIEQRLKPFLECLAESLTVSLAYRPMDEWPPLAIVAFYHAAKQYPELAREYKEIHKEINNGR